MFVVGLYVSVRVLNLSNHDLPLNAPIITACYLLFMILYLVWDSLERPSEKSEEQQYIDRILKWEKWSIAALIGWFIFYVIFMKWWHVRSPLPTYFLLVILSLVTWYFARYTWEKRSFYKD